MDIALTILVNVSPISFIFIQVLAKFDQRIGWHPHLFNWRPLRKNLNPPLCYYLYNLLHSNKKRCSNVRLTAVCDFMYLLSHVFYLLPASTKLGQGNIFTGVCDSVHRGGLPQCMLGYQPPLWSRHPPWSRTPRTRPPGSRAPLLDQTPPLPGADPPGADTPQEQTSTPGSRRQHTVNERPVRILLECILVYFKLHVKMRLLYYCQGCPYLPHVL